ncbi:MAG: BadF/BadG/BcrA/BcrD ATPase family protein [Armatimonadota bacterium]
MMRCILSIDTGGTKSEALLVRDDGVALGHGYSCDIDPSLQSKNAGSGRGPRAITLAILQALGDTPCDELHLSLVNEGLPYRFAFLTKYDRLLLHYVHEPVQPLALAGVDCGVVALAGTGAFVFGKTHDGRVVYLDGLGPLLGDYGSAYQIGWEAIRAASRSDWHPRHQTSLTCPIYQATIGQNGMPGGHSLVNFMHSERDRSRIAQLAPIVDAEANAGDAIARKILEHAAASLSETLFDVVNRLEIAREEYTLVAAGGVATKSNIFWEHFCSLAKEIAPGLQPVQPELPAVVGNAMITLKKLGAADPDTLRRNLFSTVKEQMERSRQANPMEWEDALAKIRKR